MSFDDSDSPNTPVSAPLSSPPRLPRQRYQIARGKPEEKLSFAPYEVEETMASLPVSSETKRFTITLSQMQTLLYRQLFLRQEVTNSGDDVFWNGEELMKIGDWMKKWGEKMSLPDNELLKKLRLIECLVDGMLKSFEKFNDVANKLDRVNDQVDEGLVAGLDKEPPSTTVQHTQEENDQYEIDEKAAEEEKKEKEKKDEEDWEKEKVERVTTIPTYLVGDSLSKLWVVSCNITSGFSHFFSAWEVIIEVRKDVQDKEKGKEKGKFWLHMLAETAIWQTLAETAKEVRDALLSYLIHHCHTMIKYHPIDDDVVPYLVVLTESKCKWHRVTGGQNYEDFLLGEPVTMSIPSLVDHLGLCDCVNVETEHDD